MFAFVFLLFIHNSYLYSLLGFRSTCYVPLQEDMDSMQKELEMRKEENKEHQIALRREQRLEVYSF